MKTSFLSILFGAVFFTANAQIQKQQVLFKPYALNTYSLLRGEKKSSTKFLLNFDNYRSKVVSEWVKISGLRIGIEIDNIIRTGFGIYAMSEPLIVTDNQLKYTVTYNYRTFFVETVLHESYKWEFSIGAALGRGKGNIFKQDTVDHSETNVVIPQTELFVLSANGLYKIIPWFGVGLGLGVRKMLTDDKLINKGLSSPFYAVKFKLILSELIKAIFKPEQYRQEREEYLQQKSNKSGHS